MITIGYSEIDIIDDQQALKVLLENELIECSWCDDFAVTVEKLKFSTYRALCKKCLIKYQSEDYL